MRPFWILVLILGIFWPLVIQAEPFGDTVVEVYDAEFLDVPPGPPTPGPEEVPVPAWLGWSPDPDPLPLVAPILSPEPPA